MEEQQVSLNIQSATEALRNAEEALSEAIANLETLRDEGGSTSFKMADLELAKSHVESAQSTLEMMSFG